MKLQKHLIKKKTYKKVIPFVMAGAMLAQTATPVLAAQTESQDVGYDEASAGTQKDAVVKTEKNSEFTVTIPKMIMLDSNDAADYTVNVKGSVLPDEFVKVKPHDNLEDVDGINFTMQELAGKKADAIATAVQDDTLWASTEITAEGTEKPGSITAEGITAGTWEGNLTFDINMDGSGSGGTGGETGGETEKENINTLLGAVTISSSNADGNVVNPGDVLSVVTEKTEGIGDLSYKWFADGEEIADETGSSYTVKDSDAGKTISAEVRSSLSDGVAKADFKAAVTEAKADINTLLGSVTISSSNADGNVVNPGDVLSVVTEKMEGTGDLSYKWFADGEEITDETGNSYTVKDSDIGKTISAEVRSSLSDGVAKTDFRTNVTETKLKVGTIEELSEWNYTLNKKADTTHTEDNTILLISRKKNSTKENEIIYPLYEIDGKQYKTVIKNKDKASTGAVDYLFNSNSNLKTITFEKGIDMSETTDLSYAFYGCDNLEKIYGLKNLDMSNVTSVDYMFYHCVALKEIDLSGCNLVKATSWRSTFDDCRAVTSIKLGNYLKTIYNATSMFYGCCLITELDLTSVKIASPNNNKNTFRSCSNLVTIYVKRGLWSEYSNMYIYTDCGTDHVTYVD